MALGRCEHSSGFSYLHFPGQMPSMEIVNRSILDELPTSSYIPSDYHELFRAFLHDLGQCRSGKSGAEFALKG